jgi:UDP-N-acetylmuramoylalanine--D-glutamate ligase
MIPVTIFAGCNVAVVGAGLSGLATARALKAGGARVRVWDDEDAALEEVAEAGLTVADLPNEEFYKLAAVVLAPGIPRTHPKPHWTVQKAHEAGVEVIGDIELFFREREKSCPGATVVAITGTNGKSTTTALTAHLLEAAGKQVELGGNIGRAVLDLSPFAPDVTYVIELSSFQIDLTSSLAPDAAALLNITPDHLDRHGTLADYSRIKARIFALLGADGTAVIGVDDTPSRAIAETLHGPFAVKHVAVGHAVQNGVWASEAILMEMEGNREVGRVELQGVGSLRGTHNWQNAATAYALARSQGLDAEIIQRGLKTFGGLAHRMEQVARAGNVLFVNDSKATNADATAKALGSFDEIYWIVGGRAKEGGLTGLESFYPRIARAYLIGEASKDFARQLGDAVPHVTCETIDVAVEQAAADASLAQGEEPVVLLSPACASYDQFPNFAKRGDAFRERVLRLDGATSVTQQGRAA